MLTFDADAHVYTLDGTVVPSVTGVLKAAGLINFDGVPAAILEQARTRGTAVHQAVHYFNEQDLDLKDFCIWYPDYAGYVQSWVKLMDSGRLTTVLCEHRVASHVHQVAGTIDWLGTFDGVGAIIDFATGHPADTAKDLQTAAYLTLAREWKTEPGEAILQAFLDQSPFIARYSVRLSRTGALPTPIRYRGYDDAREFLTLLHAQQIAKRRQPAAINWAEWAA